MNIIKTKIPGVYSIHLEKDYDERGFFTRTFDVTELRKEGILFNIVQTSLSYNKKKRTTRGLHYQDYPFEEDKIVQCVRGSIYDVIVDLRKDSPTYKKWMTIDLTGSSEAYNMLLIPKGFAHGFQTFEDNTLVLYYMNQFYNHEYSRVINWKSPELNIEWIYNNPKDVIMSSRDRNAPNFPLDELVTIQ